LRRGIKLGKKKNLRSKNGAILKSAEERKVMLSNSLWKIRKVDQRVGRGDSR